METLLGCVEMRAREDYINFSNVPPAIKFKATFRVEIGGQGGTTNEGINYNYPIRLCVDKFKMRVVEISTYPMDF
jgi:hypothetical protein